MLASSNFAAAAREAAREVAWRFLEGLKKQLGREALSALLHVAILLALVSLFRPLFFRGVSELHYRAPSILVSMVKSDLNVITQSARKHGPAYPEYLIFFVPLVLFLVSKRKLRWTDWEHGKSLRVYVMLIVGMLAWSGATFPFNLYLNRGHFLDRFCLAAFAALAWRFPVMVPLAVRTAIVMIKEPYIPIPHDDFDFRAPAELVVVFSIFAWASASRSFKPWHFLVVGIGSFADYYYSAGLAKWSFGPPHSWLNENPVSNISVAGYVRGWASWVPEETFLRLAELARKADPVFLHYTMVIELAALFAFFLHPKLTRWIFLGCFLLNFGIFMMTGICFWKWMTVSLGAFIWMSRSGAPLVEKLHQHKLALLLGVAAIYHGNERIWFYPQTHVVWYDTRLTENYELYAVGESGKRYLVPPTYLEPMDMHFTQGRLCYATDNERSVTGIYGTTGGYRTMKQLEEFKSPKQAFDLQRRGRPCKDPKQQAKFDDVMKTFFGNLNRRGKRPHGWLKWLGRPTHLWVFPKGELYDAQEKVVRIELSLTVVYHHEQKLHRSEPKVTHSVDIPR